MKIHLIYPKWPKLDHQTKFNLPPHGPACFAATLGDDVELTFSDENVEELSLDEDTDLVALSVMLTCQRSHGERDAGHGGRRSPLATAIKSPPPGTSICPSPFEPHPSMVPPRAPDTAQMLTTPATPTDHLITVIMGIICFSLRK